MDQVVYKVRAGIRARDVIGLKDTALVIKLVIPEHGRLQVSLDRPNPTAKDCGRLRGVASRLLPGMAGDRFNFVNPGLGLFPTSVERTEQALVPGVDEHVVHAAGRVARVVLPAALPRHIRNEVLRPEHLVEEQPEVPVLVVVDGNDHDPVVGQEATRQLQPGVHHAQPVGVEAAVRVWV